MPTVTCPKCQYMWTSRVRDPKKCPNPHCGASLNYPMPKREEENASVTDAPNA